MRIANLVPSATEMCFALGVGDEVVAVTHECDHPEAARALPQLTRTVIPEGLDALAIDRAVRERTERGEALYELDEPRLVELGVDLIVTQEVCAVCAVSYDDVITVAERLPTRPEVLSLDPSTLTDVLDDALRLGAAVGRPELGERLRADLAARIETVRSHLGGRRRPRVAALEWLDPVYVAGHWVPEMIDAAGGVDALASPGERSRTASWEQVREARPDVIVVMPCGLDCDQALAEAERHRDRLGALGAGAVHAVDAAASFSRPGPRLADGVELLAGILHPDAVAPARSLRSERVDLRPSGASR